MSVSITAAVFPAQRVAVEALFREYQMSLGIDLGFQGFEDELRGLPGKYALPDGRLLLGWSGEGSEPAGCVALRRLDEETSEIKRLYVRPSARGTGLGGILARAIVGEAKRAGYRRVWLDTLPSMTEAVALYGKLGFTDIAPYTYNPLEGARYLGLEFDSIRADDDKLYPMITD
ncbi:MAG: GNAT family N-acetyltransferase [Hyphomicrobiaceae bacterium]